MKNTWAYLVHCFVCFSATLKKKKIVPVASRGKRSSAEEPTWTAYVLPVLAKGPDDPIYLMPGDDLRRSAALRPGEKVKILHGSGKKGDGLEKRGKRSQTTRKCIGPKRKSCRKAPDVERLLKYRDLHPEEYVGVRPFVLGGTWPVAPVAAPTAEYLDAVRRGLIPGVQLRDGLVETYEEVDFATHDPPPTDPDVTESKIVTYWEEGKNIFLVTQLLPEET